MFAEMKGETLPFRVFGKVYEIRKAIPAALVLELARRESGEELDDAFLLRAGEVIFGQATLHEIAAHEGFTLDMLAEMIKWAFAEINGPDEGDAAVTEDDAGVKHPN